MFLMYNVLDFVGIQTTDELACILTERGCEHILIKKLGKNNNDKQQIYFHHDASLLNSVFDLTFTLRESSHSKKRGGAISGKRILSAVFNNFHWLGCDGSLHQVLDCKGVLYAQYPEFRLSGFKASSGLMPRSMSWEFARENQEIERYLALGATPEGKAVAVMLVEPANGFFKEFMSLPLMAGSSICRKIKITQTDGSDKLKAMLKERIGGRSVKGCRLDADGNTLPFMGTQVHGYTLEHELGIRTNASKGGDIFGIELKCFTSKKLTLFTPEPDGGLYAESFTEFMTKYGYETREVYRFTGLHRVGSVSEKSGLTLRVVYSAREAADDEITDYDPERPLSHQMQNLQVILTDDLDFIAASWSVERLLNNWGVKHQEAVYVPAKVTENDQAEEIAKGFGKKVTFASEVLWCKKTSLEYMINAIANGVIFLDPAPKYDVDSPRNNKRRSQWRINNIYRDSHRLYESVEEVGI
jgi:hypothetical protein